MDPTRGRRVANARKRLRITQAELARQCGLSPDTVKAIEQDKYKGMQPRTARKLALVTGMTVPQLLDGEPPAPAPGPRRERWEPVRQAIAGEYPDMQERRVPSLDSLQATFAAVTPLLLAGHLSASSAGMPALLHDISVAAGHGPSRQRRRALTLQSQARQVAGALMLHVREFDAAEQAFTLARDGAQDQLTYASVADERCWGLITEGRFSHALERAMTAAEMVEPGKISKASDEQLAAWGRMLMRAAAAAARAGRDSDAREALRLAKIAAGGIRVREDFILPYAPWHLWGRTALDTMRAELAVVSGTRKGAEHALRLDKRLNRDLTVKYAPSHRLRIAQAHVTLGDDPAAVGELEGLWRRRPEWLPRQPGAADILQEMIGQRRRVTGRVTALADALRLPY